jgi:NAD(P)H-hydrate epimerase
MNNSPDLWRDKLPRLLPDGNKYDRGHLLIFGGETMTGAARLAARAAQRAGAGLVTIACAPFAFPIYAAALESVLVQPIEGRSQWRDKAADPKMTTLLLGPGMGRGEETQARVLESLLTKKPCVLDADALTSFENDPEKLFCNLHESCVLTPHEGEFSRLFGRYISREMAKEERAKKAAVISGCVVLLKGAETVVADPAGQITVNRNAPPWLATAGAGDVLAGIIAGLIAQGMPVFWAASAGAWIHGALANLKGQGLIAEDLVNYRPWAQLFDQF